MDIGDPVRKIENVPLEFPISIPVNPGEWPVKEPKRDPVPVEPVKIEEPVEE